MAVERLSGVFERQNTWVITNQQYADQVAEVLDMLPRENIVGEPEGRDTASAIALAAEILAAKDPEGTMAVFTADHVIRPVDSFVQAVNTACQAAESRPDSLVTFGVKPTWPHTGLGYIHCGQSITNGLYEVRGFREKPDRHLARRYVESGQHYWNSGMFVWKIATIRQALKDYLPASASRLEPIGRAIKEGADYTKLLADIYPTLEKISIDFAVMEKAPKVLMVELHCRWLDVGSWPALENVVEPDGADNTIVAKNVAVLDSERNIIVSEDEHLIALLGMDDCVVVHSDDATLVCRKSDSQRLKELVELLEEKFGRRFL